MGASFTYMICLLSTSPRKIRNGQGAVTPRPLLNPTTMKGSGESMGNRKSPNLFYKGEMILDTFFRATSDTFYEPRHNRSGKVVGSRPYIFCECTLCGSPAEKRQVENIRGNKNRPGDKSCGCRTAELASERQHKPIKAGEVFSSLTAISDTRRVRKEYKDVKAGRSWRYMYELDVRCECGKEFVAHSQDLMSGATTRCYQCSCVARGETRKQTTDNNLDVIRQGTVLGYVLALHDSRMIDYEYSNVTTRVHSFIGTCLRCDSGEEREYDVRYLLRGDIESCGCLNRDRVRASHGNAWSYAGKTMLSSWEVAIAVEFDHLGIDYEYEPEGFDIEGKKYWPDFYLPDHDKYIEVKGYERDVSMNKADVFSSRYDLEIWRRKEIEAFTGFSVWNLPKVYDTFRKGVS